MDKKSNEELDRIVHRNSRKKIPDTGLSEIACNWIISKIPESTLIKEKKRDFDTPGDIDTCRECGNEIPYEPANIGFKLCLPDNDSIGVVAYFCVPSNLAKLGKDLLEVVGLPIYITVNYRYENGEESGCEMSLRYVYRHERKLMDKLFFLPLEKEYENGHVGWINDPERGASDAMVVNREIEKVAKG